MFGNKNLFNIIAWAGFAFNVQADIDKSRIREVDNSNNDLKKIMNVEQGGCEYSLISFYSKKFGETIEGDTIFQASKAIYDRRQPSRKDKLCWYRVDVDNSVNKQYEYMANNQLIVSKEGYKSEAGNKHFTKKLNQMVGYDDNPDENAKALVDTLEWLTGDWINEIKCDDV